MFLTPVSDTLSTPHSRSGAPLLDSLPACPAPAVGATLTRLSGKEGASDRPTAAREDGRRQPKKWAGSLPDSECCRCRRYHDSSHDTLGDPQNTRGEETHISDLPPCSTREWAASSGLQSSEQVTARGPRGSWCPVQPHGISLSPSAPHEAGDVTAPNSLMGTTGLSR